MALRTDASTTNKGAKILIDDVEHVVDQGELSGTQLKKLGGKEEVWPLFLEQGGDPDIAIADDEVVQINGGEQFRTSVVVKAYEIFVDEIKYVVESKTLTGTQIKKLAGKPHKYKLFLERPGHPDKQIRDDESVQIRTGEHFHAVPPATFG